MCASQYTRVNSYHCTCTVYSVSRTLIQIWASQYTHVYSSHCTALYNKRCTPKACTPMAPVSASARVMPLLAVHFHLYFT